MEGTNVLANCVKQISRYSDDVDCFLDGSEQIYDAIVDGTKIISDFSKACIGTIGDGRKKGKKNNRQAAFQELHVKGFDCEQIWQGVEINNEQQTEILGTKINELLKSSDGQLFLVKNDVPESKMVETESIEDENSILSDDIEGSQSSESDLEDIPNPQIESDKDSSKDEIENDYSEDENSEPEKTGDKLSSKKSGKKSKVDDDFFVLEDMNKFLDAEDRKEMRTSAKDGDNDEENIDYFADELSDGDSDSDDEFDKILNSASEAAGRAPKSKSTSSNGRTVMYKEFFDPPATESRVKHKENISPEGDDEMLPDESGAEDSDIEMSESDNEKDDVDDDKNLEDDPEANTDKGNKKADQFESKHEKQSKKIKEKIVLLEKENLAQKPWQLIGEATAAKRPKNSLLEEHLTFDQTLVGAPTITEETTETLEDMIKQRVKDQAWDDVIRKVKPVEKPFEYKKSLGLDQEKSKLSLAEVYEKEYIKQTQDVKEDETNPDHEVIQNMMDKLFSKLDALSNFQYTPKQPKPELKIITNLPSLQVEEFTPVTVSTEARLAPEEIYDKEKGDVKGQGEKTSTDRKRERREKKAKKKDIIKSQEKKMKQGSKQSKKAVLETVKKNKRSMKIAEAGNVSGKTLKSSTAFFNQLQENVGQQLKNEKKKQSKRKEISEKAERYKL